MRFHNSVRFLTLVAVLAVTLGLAVPSLSSAAPAERPHAATQAAPNAGWWDRAWQWLATLLPGPSERSGHGLGVALGHDGGANQLDRGILIDPNGTAHG
jgi:hypothetical protein